MTERVPILLSYYAVSNGNEILIFGQVSVMRASDLSFTNYSRRRTFRTLLSLYRTRPFANEPVSLIFESFTVSAKTDATGFFLVKSSAKNVDSFLMKAVDTTDTDILIMDGLYSKTIHHVKTPNVVVSDIDDTILHSYISRKVLKFRTLMFTPVEKRRAVEPMKKLVKSVVRTGATAIYLSNSEQNLYPLIYRFLIHHDFPPGPLFLKQMRRLRDVLRYRKLPTPEVHKMKMLDEIIPFFSPGKFVLVGDNTQYDIPIYLSAAKKYPERISHIFIRRVRALPDEKTTMAEITNRLSKENIEFYYDDDFPELLEW